VPVVDGGVVVDGVETVVGGVVTLVDVSKTSKPGEFKIDFHLLTGLSDFTAFYCLVCNTKRKQIRLAIDHHTVKLSCLKARRTCCRSWCF